MKKLLIALLVLVMVCSFGLAGCGSASEEAEATDETAVTEEQEAVEEEAEEPAEEVQAEAEETQAAEAVQQEESKAAAAPKTQTEKKASTQKAASTQKTQTQQKAQTQSQSQPQQQAQATEKKTGSKADAESYTGKSLSDYEAQYGQPSSSSYSSSCLGDGQDGEHHYDGYTVYTYKDENGEEKIQGVE